MIDNTANVLHFDYQNLYKVRPPEIKQQEHDCTI